jgi:hypothetical protein
MRRVTRFLSAMPLPAAVGLAAYGGYGAGLARFGDAGPTHWLIVAGLLTAAAGLQAFGVWNVRRAPNADPQPPALSLSIVESLAPVLLEHADGREVLQDLVEILVESSHRSAATTLAAKGGRPRA